MRAPRLSVVVVTRDEEDRIRACLESVAWADELVVIDAESQDKTASVARELGLSVPGDLAVVGYDNTSWCDLAQNGLTSIDQSGQVLGLQAARLLIERIKGRVQPEHFVVTPRLVARQSTSRRAT